MTPLAVLRPEPGNAATAGRIEALGLLPIRLPLFAVRALDWSPPDPADFDALLLTSANAIRFGGPGLDMLRRLPVLAVGAKTADAARLAGFDVMTTGDAGVAALLGQAEGRGVHRMLHLAGRDRSIDASEAAAAVIATYASEALPLDAIAMRRLKGAVALLHSPRAADRLATLLAIHGLPRSEIGLAALSPAVAAAAGPGWASVAIAATPTDSALIDAARARD